MGCHTKRMEFHCLLFSSAVEMSDQGRKYCQKHGTCLNSNNKDWYPDLGQNTVVKITFFIPLGSAGLLHVNQSYVKYSMLSQRSQMSICTDVKGFVTCETQCKIHMLLGVPKKL